MRHTRRYVHDPAQAEFVGGAEDANGNLAAVCSQQLLNHFFFGHRSVVRPAWNLTSFHASRRGSMRTFDGIESNCEWQRCYSLGRQSVGGKAIFQKSGAGESNSMGT